MANNQKKYVSLSRLSTFLDNIKTRYSLIGHKHTTKDITDYKVDTELSSTSTNPVQNKVLDAEFDAISTAMNALDAAIDGKSDSGHNHDSAYATKNHNHDGVYATANHNHDTKYDTKGSASAVQENLDTVSDTLDAHTENTDIHVTTANKTNWNSAYTHSTSAHARADATKVADSTTNGNILINGTETNVYSHPNSGVSAGTYKSVTVNAQGHVTAGSNPTTLAGYGITDGETKGTASSAVSTHNTSTSAHGDIRDLITGLTTRLNTLANSDDTTLDQMSEIVTYIKNNKSLIDSVTTNKVNVADIVNNLTTNVTNKPLSAAQGVSIKALIDALDLALDSHDANTTKHITSTERTNWNAAKTHADSAHAPSNAQPNQNAFSNIKVGSTTIVADTTTDTLTLEGTNVTITPDATNDKVTISVADATTSAKGVVQLTDSVTSTSTTTAATPKNVKAAYDLANTAKTTAEGKANASHTHTVANITDLTATATELNYMDGVTSNVQAQLDSKADSATLIGRAGEGSGAEIFNDYSSNTASGRQAHAEGYGTTASGMRAHAEGQNSTASAQATHAEGYNTQATATAAHSEGYYTEATGKYSHAEGYMSKAQEQYAHAEGYSNTASGEASHAEGYSTWADGNSSHTEGCYTTASGDYSHAEGFYVEAAGRYQHVQGKYNIIDEDSGGNSLDTYAHIVGNGSSNSNRSNAHTVDWDGNAWFAGNIYVGGTSQNSGATMVSSISTLTTAEYTALEEAQATNANTLYMLTDAEEETPTQVQIITWEDDD